MTVSKKHGPLFPFVRTRWREDGCFVNVGEGKFLLMNLSLTSVGGHPGRCPVGRVHSDAKGTPGRYGVREINSQSKFRR